MLKAKTKINDLEKNYCLIEQQRKNLSVVKMAVNQILLLIPVLVASTLAYVSPVYAQPTNNLEAKYYSTDNRYSNFSNFGGTVIETRTWDKINTRNYNPKSRR